MASLDDRSRLHVEGKDDRHAICHLLIRHGIDYDRQPWPRHFPRIHVIGGKDSLLDGIETAVSVSNGRAVGFVLDANSSLQDRWNAVSSRLKNVGMDIPDEIPRNGFVGEALNYRARVGVWLMPDNQQEGTLEHFLSDLVREAEPLLPHAKESTRRAKELNACFSEKEFNKAVLHTWLSWQETPGLPYGSAIRARYFHHDSQAARNFVDWFCRVFEIVQTDQE